MKLFDLSAGKMTRHFRGHMSNVTVIDCGSFDRRFVTTGSMDCQVRQASHHHGNFRIGA